MYVFISIVKHLVSAVSITAVIQAACSLIDEASWSDSSFPLPCTCAGHFLHEHYLVNYPVPGISDTSNVCIDGLNKAFKKLSAETIFLKGLWHFGFESNVLSANQNHHI